MKYKVNNKYVVDAKSPKEAIERIEKFKDSKKLKDSYFIVACEQGDFWYNEIGKPDSFKNAKKFSSYEEADRWRRNKGSGSVQKVTDSTKDYDKKNIINYLNGLVGNIGLHVERQIDNYKYLLRPNKKWDYHMADQVRKILESKGHEAMIVAPEVYVTLNELAKYDSTKDSEKLKDSYIIETMGGTYTRYLQNDNRFGFNKEEAKKLNYNEAISLVNSYKKSNPDLKLKIVIDSCKDEKIYKVNVKNAEDRDVDRFITTAQNIGFTTDDRGFVIYLKNGNDDMLRNLKSKMYTTNIIFEDSCEDEKIYKLLDNIRSPQIKAGKTFISHYGSNNKEIFKILDVSENIVTIEVNNVNGKFVQERTMYDLLEYLNRYNFKLQDSCKDSEIDYLTQEEERAVEDYRKAIQSTTNPKLLEIYSHILQEETEHIRELQEAKKIDEQ